MDGGELFHQMCVHSHIVLFALYKAPSDNVDLWGWTNPTLV